MKIIDYAGGLKLIYDDDHDARYAHIPERFRWKYPDEIGRPPFSPIKRTKPYKELTWGDIDNGLDPCFYANDMPFTHGCIKA